jgi:hypothetical protein
MILNLKGEEEQDKAMPFLSFYLHFMEWPKKKRKT